MKAFVPDYEMKTLASLKETLAILSAEPSQWKVFAGGTDLMVVFEAGKLQHKKFLNLANFAELKGIQVSAGELRIGAMTTYSQIQAHKEIQNEFPLLVKSGWVTGAKAIQNRGTIGGNIANASPAADTPPSLLAYEADIELMSSRGLRKLAYNGFHTDYKKTEMKPTEIISAVILKRPQTWSHHYYRKVGTRSFQAISKIAFSGAAQVENGVIKKVRVGLASVAAFPIRAIEFEKSIEGKNISQLNLDAVIGLFEKSIVPLDDIRSTAAYRQSVAGRVASHFLQTLQQPDGVYSF